MRKIIITIFMAFVAFSVQATSYIINDAAVDVLVQQATESEMLNIDYQRFADIASGKAAVSQKNATTAVVLSLLLGELGVHRLYLGTSMGVFITYVITLGGCGTLWLVDSLLLVIAIIDESSIDRYIENPSLFMWVQ